MLIFSERHLRRILPDGDLLRLCHGRVVLRGAETERVYCTQYPSREQTRRDVAPLHRITLQYQTPPLGTRLSDPKEVYDEYMNRRSVAYRITLSDCPENAEQPSHKRDEPC